MSDQAMIGMIAAVSPEWVIGLRGQIPWNYPADMRRFKRVTTGSAVIMGRLTWESMGKKPLPNRRNIVISQRGVEGVETYFDIASALAKIDGPVWFIGGRSIYEEGMRYANRIDLTFVPNHVTDSEAVRFPEIDPSMWKAGPLETFEDDPRLARRIFIRV